MKTITESNDENNIENQNITTLQSPQLPLNQSSIVKDELSTRSNNGLTLPKNFWSERSNNHGNNDEKNPNISLTPNNSIDPQGGNSVELFTQPPLRPTDSNISNISSDQYNNMQNILYNSNHLNSNQHLNIFNNSVIDLRYSTTANFSTQATAGGSDDGNDSSDNEIKDDDGNNKNSKNIPLSNQDSLSNTKEKSFQTIIVHFDAPSNFDSSSQQHSLDQIQEDKQTEIEDTQLPSLPQEQPNTEHDVESAGNQPTCYCWCFSCC